jgi:hypothetical protein
VFFWEPEEDEKQTKKRIQNFVDLSLVIIVIQSHSSAYFCVSHISFLNLSLVAMPFFCSSFTSFVCSPILSEVLSFVLAGSAFARS